MSKIISRNVVSTVALLAALGLGTSALATDSATDKADDTQMQNSESTTMESGSENTASDSGNTESGSDQAASETESESSTDQAAGSDDAAGDDATAEVETETDTDADVAVTDDDSEMKSTDQAETETTTETENQTVAAEEGEPVEGQIVFQDEDTFLVSSLIGASVETRDGETIGDINDVLAAKDGTIEGIVIGVGGFLGLGEKDVAIEYGRIELTTEEDGDDVRLVLDTTEEELEKAPEFKTVEAQADEAEMKRMQDEQQNMQNGTQPAPDAGATDDAGNQPADPAKEAAE